MQMLLTNSNEYDLKQAKGGDKFFTYNFFSFKVTISMAKGIFCDFYQIIKYLYISRNRKNFKIQNLTVF